MVERWGLPQKTLPNPRLIINVDRTKNKASAVTEVCVLNVLHQENQQLQQFYVMDLGFDWVLLRYPWLHEFNPQINWKGEGVVGEVTLKIIVNVWEKWRNLRRKALVASVQVNSTTVDETEIRRDMCTMWELELTMIEEQSDAEWGAMIAQTNFTQNWAKEANKAKQVPTAELPKEYKRHMQIFLEEVAKWFPPSRPKDHTIWLKPGTPDKIKCKIYPMMKQELEATRKILDDNLALGYIEECDNGGSPWLTPFFYTDKKDGGLRPLHDYQAVNSWTIKDNYPIPHIKQILEGLEGKELLTALDIRWGYHNI